MSSPAWAPMGADVVTPRAWWPLDEASGVSIRDAGTYDHVGTLAGGCSWGLDGPKPGWKAIEFNGSSGYMSAASNAIFDALSFSWTLAAWAYPTALRQGAASSSAGIVTRGYPGSGVLQCVLAYGGEGTEVTVPANSLFGGFYNQGTGGWKSVYDPNTLPLNTWTHCAITLDGVTLRLYRNGVEVANKAGSGDQAVSGQGFYVGRRWDLNGNGPYFPGRICGARVYSRALPASEILALYQMTDQAEIGIPPFVPTA